MNKNKFIEPILIKAGSGNLRIGQMLSPPKRDCRVISEDNYQELKKAFDAVNRNTTSDDGIEIYKQIKSAMKESCITHKSMAEKVGVDKNTITRFLNGHNGIGYYVLENIVDVLGLELTKKAL